MRKKPPPAIKYGYAAPAAAPKETGLAELTGPLASAPDDHVDLTAFFGQFDTSGDGFLQMGELRRAFMAMDLQKKDGSKFEVDESAFKLFDTDSNGKVSLAEFNANLHPRMRIKIEEKIRSGWTFDAEKWAKAPGTETRKHDMEALFMQFDANGDGKLDMRELARAFRALGLEKRSGAKLELDEAMFKSFGT